MIIDNWKFNTALKQGFTLIEIIIYVALLGFLSVFAVNSLVHVAGVYRRTVAEREIVSNARLVLETVTDAARSAQEVYTPTSRLNNDAGQLSLVSTVGTDVLHAAIYRDFWIDNGIFFSRQEGQTAVPLSAASVRVSVFRVERIIQAIDREIIKVTIRVDPLNLIATSVMLNATIALRGNY